VDVLALISRTVLAGVLAAAGAAKLRDLPGSRKAMAGFGVPDRLVSAAAIGLPVAELALAVALVVPSLAGVASFLALGLLATMTAAIARLLSRGEAPDCHCFGALDSRPVGPATLVRSIALGALAAFVAIHGPGTVIGGAPFGLEAVVPLLTGLGAAFAARPQDPRRPPLFPDAPPAGAVAPRFELPYAIEGRSSLDSLLARGDMLMLVFVDAGCGPCKGLLGSLGRWVETVGEELSIAVISKGEVDANRALCRSTGIPDVLLQEDSEVARAYGVLPTPSAVLVAPDGTVASAPVAGVHGIEALLRLALDSARGGVGLAPTQRRQG
jgi:uncharacterized membrane protein YphA (DoxX/SURF4 family)